MSRYVMDTGIVLGLLKGASYARHVLDTYQPFAAPNLAVQSVTTVAELKALGFRRTWGQARLDKLDELVHRLPQQDINHPTIIRYYAEIDAYRQNGHPDKRLPPGESAFAMGDNDIWIAATASAMNAVLLTTDKDFKRLDRVFLNVVNVDPKGYQDQP